MPLQVSTISIADTSKALPICTIHPKLSISYQWVPSKQTLWSSLHLSLCTGKWMFLKYSSMCNTHYLCVQTTVFFLCMFYIVYSFNASSLHSSSVKTFIKTTYTKICWQFTIQQEKVQQHRNTTLLWYTTTLTVTNKNIYHDYTERDHMTQRHLVPDMLKE